MKVQPRKWIWRSLLLSAWGGYAACAWGSSADLAIYNLDQRSVSNISSNRFREVVIDASPQHTNFFTITRLEAPKLIMRERAESGAILSVIELPFFVSNYAARNWIAMSPDRKRLVFLNPETRGLSLLSLASGERRELSLRGVIPSPIYIVLMKWLSGDTVLLLRRGVRGTDAAPGEILRLNVDSGASESCVRSFRLAPMAHALSQSGKSLATVGNGQDMKIEILDVATMRMVKELPAVRADQTVGALCWLDEDTRLAFLSVGDGPFCYTVGTGEVMKLNLKGIDRYHLRGSVGRHLVLGKDGTEEEGTYFLYDIASGKTTRIDAHINGSVYPIAENRRLVMEVGY